MVWCKMRASYRDMQVCALQLPQVLCLSSLGSSLLIGWSGALLSVPACIDFNELISNGPPGLWEPWASVFFWKATPWFQLRQSPLPQCVAWWNCQSRPLSTSLVKPAHQSSLLKEFWALVDWCRDRKRTTAYPLQQSVLCLDQRPCLVPALLDQLFRSTPISMDFSVAFWQISTP